MRNWLLAWALAAAWLGAALGWAEEEDLHGGEGILFWTPEQQIVGYRAIDDLYPTREIKAGGHPYPLIPAERDFSTFRYRHEGERRTVDEYMASQRIAGLIAVKDGKVALERYGLGNDADSRWISFSIAKSVVSLLIGAAILDGYIESVDDLVVDYLPRLKGGVYDEVTIRHILQMSSGVAWNEDYADP
ncbi:MAG: beta-lactamase family protein, partial [Gammaproteobacteria bacterium]|nr:beta-lactamase family protein [Gammaproteobacteria bacterium]